jgi:hypothetical protein
MKTIFDCMSKEEVAAETRKMLDGFLDKMPEEGVYNFNRQTDGSFISQSLTNVKPITIQSKVITTGGVVTFKEIVDQIVKELEDEQ